MSKYIFQRGAAPLLQWTRGVPPGMPPKGDRQLMGIGMYEPVTVIPGGPEPIQGLVDEVTAHPILTALGVALAYHYGKKLARKGRR